MFLIVEFFLHHFYHPTLIDKLFPIKLYILPTCCKNSKPLQMPLDSPHSTTSHYEDKDICEVSDSWQNVMLV